ncbi:aldo/keto reductase [Sutcliffiella cohnii]
MRTMPLQKRNITNSRLVLGCMGLGGGWDNSPFSSEEVLKAEKAVEAALSSGITMFDHADIYTRGKAEKVFGEVLKNNRSLREQMVIQSKCAIRFEDDAGPGRYDFSKEHIINSVDGILARLNIEQLDILLLHRPDPLMEPEVVAETFELLKKEGKVQHFGVSNMNKAQVALLQTYTNESIIVNQLEMSLRKLDWVDQGVLVNQHEGTSAHFTDGFLEYSMEKDIQIQAWSPLGKGVFTGREEEIKTEAERNTAALVARMAEELETTREAIVLGWLMRHPAMIQPVIGTTNPDRIVACQDAVPVSEKMTREQWYNLYVTSRGRRLP